MHIVLVTGEYPPQIGGVGDYTALLAQNLRACRVKVTVVATGCGSASRTAAEPHPPPIRMHRAWSQGIMRQVAALAREGAPAWIHVQYQTAAFSMHPGINLAPRFWRRRGLRVAWTYHDLLPPYLLPRIGPRARDWITLLPVRDANLVISTNRADCRILQAQDCSAALIPVGSNIPVLPQDSQARRRWRQTLGVNDSDLLLGHFGLANRSKGLQTLVEALRLLHQRGLPARLVVIGGTPGTSDPANRAFRAGILNLIRTAGLEAHVTWTGALPPDAISRALTGCDMLVLPFVEGANARHGSLIACLEHGCVTVTTMPQDESLLAPGVPVVPRLSFAALADRIADLVQSPGLRRTARQAALASSCHRSWDTIAARHLQLYTEGGS